MPSLRNENGRGNAVNLTNLGLRVLQFIIGIIVISLYASQLSYDKWTELNVHPKLSVGVAAGAMSLITAPILAAIPFFLGYYIVAWFCLWDFITMCVYAATFGIFNGLFHPNTNEGDIIRAALRRYKVDGGNIDTMGAAVWVSLVGMLLWLITFLMAIGLLLFSRVRGSRSM